jgi:hypothetical protein
MGEERLMDVLRAIPSRPAYDDMTILLVPLKHRSRSYPQLFADFSGHRDLALRGNS